MTTSWYIKGVIFLGVLLGILLLILIVYFIVQRLSASYGKGDPLLEEADDIGLNEEDLLGQAVREKILVEKTLLFETTKPYDAYDAKIVEELAPEEKIIKNAVIAFKLNYNEKNNYLHGAVHQIMGLDAHDFSHIRYHFKIEKKKTVRHRSPFRPIADLKMPQQFGLSPVLPVDLTNKALRIRLYGRKSKLPGILKTERCLGEANVELSLHESVLLEGGTVETEHALLPVSTPFPAVDD